MKADSEGVFHPPLNARFRVPASKSELIRALLLQSFEPSLQILGDSRCDDVRGVREALTRLAACESHLDLGDSGLGFRCLALRVSRLRRSARVWIEGSERLLSRPHEELWRSLRELGCAVSVESRGAWITPPAGGLWACSELRLSGGQSSQFASAVLLSALGLDREFTLVIEEPLRSRGYLELTLRFLEQAGVFVRSERGSRDWRLTVPAHARVLPQARLFCEGDWSTAAALAAIAAIHGDVEMEGLSPQSAQPDVAILDWLSQMGVSWAWKGEVLHVFKASTPLRGLRVSGAQSPDLIPVFAALACLAEGRSEVHGAPQLRHKESDRIALAVKLARFLGARAGEAEDGFWIEPCGAPLPVLGAWSTDRDHRQVMAAFVALAAGARFFIDEVSVVSKSAPEFLEWMAQLEIRPRSPVFVFFGHRGTGKSALARRLAQSRALEVLDLDQEIERSCGKSISEIFAGEGEAAFRRREREALRAALSKPLSSGGRVIVCGAGLESGSFELERYGAEGVWISRSTDQQGRIFLDRPRLDPAVGPLEEFRSRAAVREARYERWSSRRLELTEGSDRQEHASAGEESLLFGLPDFSGASLTIPAPVLKDPARLSSWIALRRGWGFRFLEIREDFLSSKSDGQALDGISRALEGVAGEQLLFSRRLEERPTALSEFEQRLRIRGARLDWAQELGEPPHGFFRPGDILSNHAGQLPESSSTQGVFLKWSPEIHSWSALRDGHSWAMKDPASRVFLPRSTTGRWRYYRLWWARRYRPMLHFLREDSGSAPDQPTLLEWLQNPGAPQSFGAVLGKPVFHSRSPERHQPHFYAFEISPEEWNDALSFLFSLGLRRAAVTAPLKEVAFAWAEGLEGGARISERASRLRSVNTLEWQAFSDQTSLRVRADNTDLPGFKKAVRDLLGDPAHGFSRNPSVVLWGGGGTAAMVREVLPGVTEFSARTGEPREGVWPGPPEVLVWGVGRSVFSGVFPPESWRPRVILDLNYSEDSPGREYAQRLGPPVLYISGLGLFEAQAALQFTPAQ